MKLGSLITHQTTCQHHSPSCELNGQLLQYFLQHEFLNGKSHTKEEPLTSDHVEDVRQKLVEKHTQLNIESVKPAHITEDV